MSRASIRRLVVFLVDDDPDTLEMYALGLTHQGFTVRTTLDPAELLTQAIDDPPDCVIADLRMPRITGLELCRQLANNPRTASVPVIAITGSIRDAMHESAFREVLAKPCMPDALGLAIVRAIPGARGVAPGSAGSGRLKRRPKVLKR